MVAMVADNGWMDGKRTHGNLALQWRQLWATVIRRSFRFPYISRRWIQDGQSSCVSLYNINPSYRCHQTGWCVAGGGGATGAVQCG